MLSNTDSGGEVQFVMVAAGDKDSLDIHLSNGNIVLLETKFILELPGFEGLANGHQVLHPLTDGRTIYWRDGPRPLGVDEILSFVGKAGGEKSANSI